MCKKINRIGEKTFNKFGSEMIIKEELKLIESMIILYDD